MTQIAPKTLQAPPIIATVPPPLTSAPRAQVPHSISEVPPVIPKPPPVVVASRTGRWIWFNSQRLSDEAVLPVDRVCGRHLDNGAYWYDPSSGAWGRQGSGPCGH